MAAQLHTSKTTNPLPTKTCSKPRDNLPCHPVTHLAIQTSMVKLCIGCYEFIWPL